MTTQIEQLIETRRTLKSQTSNPVSETYIDMFIRDLQSLQPTTEERFTSFAIGVVDNAKQFKDTFEDYEYMKYPFVYCLGDDTQENRNAQVNSLKIPVI